MNGRLPRMGFLGPAVRSFRPVVWCRGVWAPITGHEMEEMCLRMNREVLRWAKGHAICSAYRVPSLSRCELQATGFRFSGARRFSAMQSWRTSGGVSSLTNCDSPDTVIRSYHWVGCDKVTDMCFGQRTLNETAITRPVRFVALLISYNKSLGLRLLGNVVQVRSQELDALNVVTLVQLLVDGVCAVR